MPSPTPATCPAHWRTVETRPADGVVVLTQHEKDLYPVAAFCMTDESGGVVWFRETEGPEDLVINGRHDVLHRAPTHWKPLPESPLCEDTRATPPARELSEVERERNALRVALEDLYKAALEADDSACHPLSTAIEKAKQALNAGGQG